MTRSLKPSKQRAYRVVKRRPQSAIPLISPSNGWQPLQFYDSSYSEPSAVGLAYRDMPARTRQNTADRSMSPFGFGRIVGHSDIGR